MQTLSSFSSAVTGSMPDPAGLFASHPLLPVLLAYLLIVNLTAFCMYGIDKRKAKKNRWRISEKALFTVALLGGSIGALLGMRVFHHKTKHWYFRWGIPLILLAQIALTVWLLYGRGI